MADTFTTTLSLTKPEVGASADTWGTKLNDNLDDIDALFSAGPVLKVANGGTAATTASGARTNLGLGTMATQDASAVAITGGSVSVGALGVSATVPYLNLTESDASTDNKTWLIYVENETFSLYAEDDGLTSGTAAVQIARTGTTVDSIALTATAVTINGNAAWHAGNDGTGSGLDADTLDGQQATAFAAAASTGSFTIYLRTANNSTELASGTAYWVKRDGVVTLRIPELVHTTANTTAVLDGLPADVQSSLATYQYAQVLGFDNGAGVPVTVNIASTGLDYFPLKVTAGLANFNAATATKGISHCCITYMV
jgi:hypothetical protein